MNLEGFGVKSVVVLVFLIIRVYLILGYDEVMEVVVLRWFCILNNF